MNGPDWNAVLQPAVDQRIEAIGLEEADCYQSIALVPVFEAEDYIYHNIATCPDCSGEMIRQGRCCTCPSCGFESCVA